MSIISKKTICLVGIIGSTFYSLNTLAAVTVNCNVVSNVTQCTFSGQGSLATPIINTLKQYPGALTLIIQSSNNLSPFTISNHNNVTIQLGANVTLTAPAKGDSSWKNHSALITVSNSNNFTLQGDSATTSILDGKGAGWWPNPSSSRPYILDIDGTTGITIQGLQFLNSPMYNVHITNSNTIAIQNLAINAPATSPNTDGINTSSILHMMINNITVNNGDDGIAINAGGTPSDDIQISDVTLINGHGLSIGSQVYNPVTNVSVNNVTMTNAQYGLRIKTRCPNNDCSKTNAGSVSNISYQNVKMTGVHYPMYFDLNYNSNDFSNVNLSNITYTSVTATNSVHPAMLICSKDNGCNGIVFNAVNMDQGGQCQGVNGGSYNKVVACDFSH